MKKSILVIMNNEHILNAVEDSLERNGLNVFSSLTSDDAYKLFYNNECDFIVSDFGFLAMDHFRLLKSFRDGKHGKKCDSPILVVTHTGNDSLALLSLYSGIEIFEPPFSLTALTEKIDVLIDTSSKQSQKKLDENNKNCENSLIHVRKGESLIREGEFEQKMFWIKEGIFNVTKNYGGQIIDFGNLGSGEVVGELSLIDELPRSASVKAVTDCKVVEIPHHIFYQLMKNQPQIIKSVIRTLCFRLRETDSKFKV